MYVLTDGYIPIFQQNKRRLLFLFQSPDVSPEEFKKDFSVSDRQYFITLLVSLCANRDWDTIDRLLTPKVRGSDTSYTSIACMSLVPNKLLSLLILYAFSAIKHAEFLNCNNNYCCLSH